MSVLFFIGQIDKSRYVKIIPCRSLQLEADRPMPLQVDGELIGEARSISVEVLEEKVQVLQPAVN
jgi:diacylglycerol kinase family enzyme